MGFLNFAAAASQLLHHLRTYGGVRQGEIDAWGSKLGDSIDNFILEKLQGVDEQARQQAAARIAERAAQRAALSRARVSKAAMAQSRLASLVCIWSAIHTQA